MAKDRQRTLSGEEAALWEGVARTAKPLRPSQPVATKPTSSAPAKEKAPPALPAAPPPVAAKNRQPGIIDRRTVRRIARGTIAIDGRLDLHGMTQAEAHDRLYRFLSDVQSEGGRLILLITGKGTYGEGDRGVLRRSVPQWLASPRFRPLVAGFEQAHRSHGGAGAFYVRIRRVLS
jgi:DNA-nicking Smr family endonuclease